MHVSIVGSGYVGTTIAACLADLGHEVTNIEIDETIVEKINAGEAPIHEAGLEERIAEHAGTRLRATTDYDAVCDTDLTFLCLPTPQHDDGSLDLSIMQAASESLGDALAGKAGSHLVVVKSTVLPGTTEDVIGPVVAERSEKAIGAPDGLELAMNPEFLRMGTAVEDFLEPEKIVVGATSEDAATTMGTLYEPMVETGASFVETGVREAELIKYANNAFLASKVSLVNELGNIAKAYGVDAYEVLEAVGLDDRISERFMRSGLGWGGSCFPKDVNALRAGARQQGYEPALLDAVVQVNDGQPRRLVHLLAHHVDLEGSQIAVLGLSFKPGTDDVRESRALVVIDSLLECGASVVAYDPVARDALDRQYPRYTDLAGLTFVDEVEDALEGADGAIVATDWPEFDDMDASVFEKMATRVLVDGRRIDIDPERTNLEVYEGLTW
ncbi:UDP-glucose 6-dehydrogenase AglM [Natronosalvus amylolyticus]|uniref:UDP-glucose 6-dehydrogenase AglM n=1 Tax=Natronosalvus amylolyticus TaxID=2961994 RepID=UPI0020CA1881|nr:UDP-glucose 6-dehydrogenase AglM [Natronosalvus amylolyticus]